MSFGHDEVYRDKSTMSKILALRIYPDPILRQKCVEVVNFDAALKELAEDMLHTMYYHKGIGLSAPQVGQTIRIMVADVTPDKTQPLVFVNPEIIDKYGQPWTYEEGCLSFPGQFARVQSHRSIWIKHKTVDGQDRTFGASDVLAVCIQHEIDHLSGKLFIDRMPQKQRAAVKTSTMRRQS